jgi:CTP synthase
MKQTLVKPNTKYIFISGGVISGLGKGTLSAALAALLMSCRFNVFTIKADMYLNIDAGTMNPLEHGETFVTQDALECDQDIGTYERFQNKFLSRKNYFTAGQIYQSLLNKERQLKYEGACVEAFPHIPLEVIEFINRFPEGTDIVLVEFGGTVGEYQNEAFFEAARMLVTESPHDVCFVHVGYVLTPDSLGEMKSKPMQMSIKALNSLGIFPDVIVCRGSKPVDPPRIHKIARAGGVREDAVFSCPNVNSVYKLPVLLRDQNILKPIFEKLRLAPRRCDLSKWEDLYKKIDSKKPQIKIAIVGKYYASGEYSLEDSYISVLEAIKHASWAENVQAELVWFNSEDIVKTPEKIKELDSVSAIIVPQGWGSRGSQGKIETIEYARKHKIPYLGLCYGMQMASIEFARHVCGIEDANSEEIDPKTKNPVIHVMADQKEYLQKKQYGGTIRLGAWPCKLKEGTLIAKMYQKYSSLPKNHIVEERHRHRYEFNNDYRETLEKKGLIISGTSPDDHLVEAIELSPKDHPYFIATQFHPELISHPFAPHPLFIGLIAAAKKR